MLYAIGSFALLVFYLGIKPDYTNLNLFIPVFQILLGIHISVSLYSFIKAFPRFNLWSRGVFAILTTFYFGIALLHHPGMVNFDTFDIQFVLAHDRLSDWQTVMYSLFFGLFSKAVPSAFPLALFHIFVLLACLYKCLKISPPRSAGAAALYLLLATLPLIQGTVLFLSRDILFGLLTTYLLLEIAEKYLLREKIDFRFLAFTFLLTFILSELRQDAKLYIPFYVILLWPLTITNRRKLILGGLLLLFSLTANVALVHKDIRTVNRIYQLTGLLHPLNYIVHSVSDSIDAQTRRDIDRVVDFDYMVQNYSPILIRPFHDQKYSLNIHDEDWNRFVQSYLRLLRDHPRLFLKERLYTLAATFNMWGYPFIASNEFDQVNSEQARFVRDVQGVRAMKLAPALQEAHSDLWAKLLYGRGLRFLFGSPLSVFAGAFLMLAWRRRYAALFLACTAFYFSRFPVVFLMAPEPQMKYYSPILYFPVFMLLILALFPTPERNAEKAP